MKLLRDISSDALETFEALSIKRSTRNSSIPYFSRKTV